jgi:hypothetical protein
VGHRNLSGADILRGRVLTRWDSAGRNHRYYDDVDEWFALLATDLGLPVDDLPAADRQAHGRIPVGQHAHGEFWLVHDYLPEFLSARHARPTLAERATAIEADMQPVPIPWDCVDGFFHSYWRRPEAYLQPAVRRGRSVWAALGRVVEDRAVGRYERTLHPASGVLVTRS